MYALYLNPMTSNTENSVCMAVAEEAETLEAFLLREQTEPYHDTGPNLFFDGPTEKQYYKVFKKGGPLEMMNPIENSFCEPRGIIKIISLQEISDQYQEHLQHDISMWNTLYGQALHL